MHSFSHESPVALIHGGADPETVTVLLLHRSLLSSKPYIRDATRMADLSKP